MAIRTKISFFLFVFCIAIQIRGQSYITLKNFPQDDRDSIYAELSRIFPKDWAIDSTNNIYLMTRSDTLLYTMYRCCTFWSNAREPYSNPTNKIKFRLKLEIDLFWTDAMIKQSQEENEEIRKEIAALPQKYKVKVIRRIKEEGYYLDKNDSAKAEAFWKEEGELKAKLHRKPSFSSKYYSFFLSENLPNSGFGCYPVEHFIPAEIRIRALEVRIKEVLKNL